MSQRLQMLQVARLARRTLGDAADLVVSFIRSTEAPDGGYCNRDGRRDLYYTSFALDTLFALEALPPDDPHAVRTRRWLDGFGDGRGRHLLYLAGAYCCARHCRYCHGSYG